jgi:hypothetical protein
MLRTVLKSQYHASLAMLREAVERCPPEEWVSTTFSSIVSVFPSLKERRREPSTSS